MAKMMNVSLVSDMNVRPELIGLEATLVPFLQFISTQRSNMFGANIAQALVVDGAEFPQIFTGWEKQFGEYEFNATKRDHDCQILAVIPKFKSHIGSDQIKTIPSYTIIYRDAETGKVDYFDRCTYTALYNGFGYLNDHRYPPRVGEYVRKETIFSTSPNHKGNLYCQGVNANVAFMTAWETTEDAFVISESLAKKCEHFAISKVKISLDENDIPLNLYGSDDEYRIMPDIDEPVSDNGLLMAVRPLEDDSFIADIEESSLSDPQHLNDDIFVAPAGAIILDVQVHMSNKTYTRLVGQQGPFTQLLKYQRHHYDYYEEILRQYKSAKENRFEIGSNFNNLVTRAMHLRPFKTYEDDGKFSLTDGRVPVNFINIEITYGYTRKVSLGSKFAGRDGAKGVVSAIWPDENMPVDEEGMRADILISPDSVFNRMNPGQMYEQFINRASELIRRRFLNSQLGSPLEAFRYIMQYIHDVRPVYAEFLNSQLLTDDDRIEFMLAVKKNGLFLMIPPFCNNINPEKIIEISEKYGINESPVTFKQVLSDGRTKTVTTKDPVCIGSKYIFLLGKIPLSMMSAIQVGYVNQFNTPSKPRKTLSQGQLAFGQTPIRYGEDELCMLIMSLGADAVARFVGTNANSPNAVRELAHRLLTDKNPTQLSQISMSTKDVIRTNVNIGIFAHQMGAIGYDVSENNVARSKEKL